MALIECRECGEEVSGEARSCPNCGIRRPGGADRTRAAAAWVLVGLVLVVVWALAGSPNPWESPYPSSWDEDQISAYQFCRRQVELDLRSPATAEFGDPATTSVVGPIPWNPDTVQVSLQVDAENAFGATIRNTFICTLSKSAKDTWTLGAMVSTP